MSYKNLQTCLQDLERTGQLVRVAECVDANLEIARRQRALFEAGGPAVLFENVRGCRFPMLANLFGTRERIRFLFRDSLDMLRKVLRLGVDPADIMRRPGVYLDWRTPLAGWCSRPKFTRNAPVLRNSCTLQELPQLKSWPQDGGAYITLPQVYTEDPTAPGFLHSNLGMYRVQISGNDYAPDEAGLHYQIHRGIGIHHASAIARGEKLRVNVFVGGPPAMSIAAVMPLPERMSELLFAGILNRRRPAFARAPGDFLPVFAEADFCLCGHIEPNLLKTEGPFGDHLGYYSLAHPFPVMKVERVFHRTNAVWPFTTVGRPPQEDSRIGEFIHELVGDIVPDTIPGVREVHAVDDCGVHPLLLAIGSERYAPYSAVRRPMELLTLANAILGTGQLSLAKYLLLAAGEDAPNLTTRRVPEFLTHILQRADWAEDLHFYPNTTIDTLDYSGGSLNRGSKLVVAVSGPPRRTLSSEIPEDFRKTYPCAVPLPGILVVQVPGWTSPTDTDTYPEEFCAKFTPEDSVNRFPLIVLVDDLHSATSTFRDFLWTLFTKSAPARDVYGLGAFQHHRHWGCAGALVIDARRKPFHAPELHE